LLDSLLQEIKMSLSLPNCPTSIKPIQHYLKIATEHEKRDPVITYWCRLAALQNGMSLDKSSKESLAVLLPLMDWLENNKKDLADNEAISNEVVASAHIENHAMKLFLWADKEDRASNFNKNVVKAFYSSGMLFDVLGTFGELTPEVAHHKKYAKWKAAYIHNCLKSGETPIAGPMATGDDEDLAFPTIPGGEDDQTGAEGTPFNQVPGGPAPGGQGYPPPGGPGYPPAGGPGYPPAGGPGYPLAGGPGYPPGGAPGGYNPPPQQPQYFPPQPVQQPPPTAAPRATNNFIPPPSGSGGVGVKLSVEQISKAQKLCKYAVSSLDYDDLESAILNLNKALHLCQTGQEMK